MPTGYTSDLYDGKDDGSDAGLGDFILQLSRGLGAYIHQRDEDGRVKPKGRTPDTWYKDNAEQAVKDLAALRKWTPEQKATAYADAKANYEKSNTDSYIRTEAMERRYRNRLGGVMSIEWPEDDDKTGEFFAGLKKFAREQLISSIEFDIHYPQDTPFEEVFGDVDAWYNRKVEGALRDVGYYTEKYEEEVKRCEQVNHITDRLYEFVEGLDK